MKDIGLALRWLRQRRRQKQHEVAELAGITRPMLSAYERGKVKPTLDTLEGILGAIGCDLAQLAGALKVVSEEIPPGLGGARREPQPAAGRSFPPMAPPGPLRAGGNEEKTYLDLQQSVLKWLDAVREHVLDPRNLLGGDGGSPS